MLLDVVVMLHGFSWFVVLLVIMGHVNVDVWLWCWVACLVLWFSPLGGLVIVLVHKGLPDCVDKTHMLEQVCDEVDVLREQARPAADVHGLAQPDLGGLAVPETPPEELP